MGNMDQAAVQSTGNPERNLGKLPKVEPPAIQYYDSPWELVLPCLWLRF
jgi:hypothetical protein